MAKTLELLPKYYGTGQNIGVRASLLIWQCTKANLLLTGSVPSSDFSIQKQSLQLVCACNLLGSVRLLPAIPPPAHPGTHTWPGQGSWLWEQEIQQLIAFVTEPEIVSNIGFSLS